MLFAGINAFLDSLGYLQLPLYLPDAQRVGSRKAGTTSSYLPIPQSLCFLCFPTSWLIRCFTYSSEQNIVSKKVLVLTFGSKRGCTLLLTSAVSGC